MSSHVGVRAMPMTPVAPTQSRLRPLGLDEIRITGGFWADRQKVNAEASIDHIEGWMDRQGWIPNFDLVADGRINDRRKGREFSDSEVYKLLEAMAWEIGRADDPALDLRFRRIVARVARAQDADGYLNTAFGHEGQAGRWSDLRWGHELYCLGHLIQAAVARERTRPGADDGLLQIAVRAADLVCDVFSEQGIRSVCGHAEIEPALVELYRVTGNPTYLRQAALFVERRGHGVLGDIEWGRAYYQDDEPIRQATVLRGHAVRAGYLAAGAVDVAAETADDSLLVALRTQWAKTVERRTYLTGGLGSYHQTEAIGDDWALPPDRAYSETCAAVASLMFSWRLLLADNETKYADLIERTLFNVIAASPSWAGTSFFYANTLHQRQPGTVPAVGEACPRAASSMRAPWFAVSCCPPNVARTLASLAGYVATVDDDGLQLHQYAASEIRTRLSDGRRVSVDVETDYPRSGLVRIVVLESTASPWTLTVRVPSWGAGARLTVQTAEGRTSKTVSPGPTSVSRAFAAGDSLELVLPVEPRLSAPDPRIDAVRGCVAVERGPEVLCLESVDLPAITDRPLELLRLDADQAPVEIGGRVHVKLAVAPDPGAAPWPYGPRPTPAGPGRSEADLDVALVPYHDWANRGPSTMRVWIPVLVPDAGGRR